jgi:hypothetical protein
MHLVDSMHKIARLGEDRISQPNDASRSKSPNFECAIIRDIAQLL